MDISQSHEAPNGDEDVDHASRISLETLSAHVESSSVARSMSSENAGDRFKILEIS